MAIISLVLVRNLRKGGEKMKKIISITREFASLIILLFLASIATSGTVAADVLLYDYTFQTESPQSIYGPGPGPSGSASRFDGVTWNVSNSIGGAGCGILGCWGQELYGSTNGKIGFTSSYRVTGGEVNATVPVQVNLGLPTEKLVPGKPFTITSSYIIPSGLNFKASSPQLGAAVDFNFQTYASFGGKTGVGFDLLSYGPYEIINVNIKPEVFAFNRDFDKELRLFGQTLVPDLSTNSIPIPLINKELEIKDPLKIYTLGRARLFPFPFFTVDKAGSGTQPLSGSDSAEVVRLALDATNLLAYTLTNAGLPVPPLNGNFGGGFFGYNLFRVEAGIGFSMKDTFTMTPEGVIIDLLLNETNEHFRFEAGDTLTFTFPQGFDEIHLTPTFELIDPYFRTNIDLLISPLIDISGLGISGFWGALGYNLIDPDPYYLYDFPIDIWDNTFQLDGFGSYTGLPFSIATTPGVPEPATMLLLGSGLIGLAGYGRKKLFKK